MKEVNNGRHCSRTSKMGKKEKNRKVFKDTKRRSMKNQYLRDAIEKSSAKQYVVKEQENMEGKEEHRFKKPANILVSKRRSLEAARRYTGEKVCVHNFASATNPGGGVLRGATAQEEAICRCSTLYFNISEENMVEQFYDRHKKMLEEGTMDVRYNDDCIYTPEIVVFKTDSEFPEIMPKEQWYHVDVITCAAPNLRKDPSNAMNPDAGNEAIQLHNNEIIDLHVKRMHRILAIAKKEEVDVVILGAFGCGAFYNPPEAVVEAMNIVLQEYRYDFKTIEFAVFCTEKDSQNYDVFYNRIVRN